MRLTLMLTMLLACGSPAQDGRRARDSEVVIQTGGSMYLWEGPGTTDKDWCGLLVLEPGEQMVGVQAQIESGDWVIVEPSEAYAFTQSGREVGFHGTDGCDSVVWRRFRVFVMGG